MHSTRLATLFHQPGLVHSRSEQVKLGWGPSHEHANHVANVDTHTKLEVLTGETKR